MKTTQMKNLKRGIPKGGTKQTKAKLPQYKAKNKLVHGKGKVLLKFSSMNPSCMRSKDVGKKLSTENSSCEEQLVPGYDLKWRKKYVPKKAAQHSMGRSLEKSVDAMAKAQLPRDIDDKRYHDVSEQRNIGSPVIVEAFSKDLSSYHIPKVLRNSNQRVQTKKDVSKNVSLHKQSIKPKRDEACVIVGELLHPISKNLNDARAALPLKTNCKLRKDGESSQNIGNNVRPNQWKSGKPYMMREECNDANNVTNIHDAGIKSNLLEKKSLIKPANATNNQDQIRFYSLRNKVVVIMSDRGKFCFTGKLVVRVLYGAIEAYGYVITTENDSIEIYSPRGYSNVSIETSEKCSENSKVDIWTALSLEGIDRYERNKLTTDIEQLQPGMAVAVLSNLETKLTRFLKVYYPFRLFPRIRNPSYNCWTNPRRAEEILQSNVYIGDVACKELIADPRVTQEITEKMLNRWRENQWSCALIAGGKSVGKSTTTRYLINSLLPVSKMVVLVDVDPGQTECTPPGCISYSVIEQPLMGPNFTHLRIPAFQLYIGDVNVSRCITRYIEGMKMLMDRLSNCPILSRLPVVINTMGFTYGIGWDIIMFTVKLIRPSFVVQIMSEKSKNNYVGYLSKQVVNRQVVPWAPWSTNVGDWSEPCDHELIVVHSQAERKSAVEYENWNMEPYQQRELVMISYLSELGQKPKNAAAFYENAISFGINEAVPYVISFESLFISIPRASVPPLYVLNVVNGNIVALCGIDVESDESQECEVTSGLRVLNKSPLCTCYGFGIVRGVDMEEKEIYISTPLPISMMRYVNCLVGCIPVPITLLQTNKQKHVPYTGETDVLPMSREHRRGYFRMRYEKVQNNA
ncbi:Polynucleotide 5'-hydroxyl-kinase NOL9 [Anthophora plagiata]